MSKKIGLIVIICTLFFGGYYYIYSNNYFKSITSIVVDGDEIRLDVGDVVTYSNDVDGVYFNDKKIGKKLEIFNDVELNDDYFDVVDDIDNYWEENDFSEDKIDIFFGYKVVENEVVELELHEINTIINCGSTECDEGVVLYIMSFDYSEDDYMHFVDEISIVYLGEGENLCMPI